MLGHKPKVRKRERERERIYATLGREFFYFVMKPTNLQVCGRRGTDTEGTSFGLRAQATKFFGMY